MDSSQMLTKEMLSFDAGSCDECGRPFALQKANRRSRAIKTLSLIISASVLLVGIGFLVPRSWLAFDMSLMPVREGAVCQLDTRHLGFDAVADKLDYGYYQPAADAWSNSSYAGSPSDEKGYAWEDIQKVRGVRVSKEEASQMRLRQGLRLDGDTYPTILGVAHNLHCLRMIRQYLYPDYYYASSSRENMEYLRMHADHCIETLRESIMCLPDLTPHSLTWQDESERVHVTLDPVVRRQCVKWDSLVAWERRREYHLDDVWRANPARSPENMAPGEAEALASQQQA